MTRIHIIGGAGSGKSYISALLSQKLHIPHYNLDDIFWDNETAGYGVKAPEEKRDQQLREIVSQDSWIVEGVYSVWPEPSFSAADKIIVLMTPLAVQETRIWTRYHERLSGAVMNSKVETEEGIHSLIQWNKNYNLNKLPLFIETWGHRGTIITVRDNLDVLELFA
jgi:adenylate kinase family enzyme